MHCLSFSLFAGVSHVLTDTREHPPATTVMLCGAEVFCIPIHCSWTSIGTRVSAIYLMFAGSRFVATAREHHCTRTSSRRHRGCSVGLGLFAFAFTACGPLASHKSAALSLFADTRVIATAREHSRPQSVFLWVWVLLFHFFFYFIIVPFGTPFSFLFFNCFFLITLSFFSEHLF